MLQTAYACNCSTAVMVRSRHVSPLQGADLTSKDGEGRTALHHAVMRSHLPAVDVILELGGPKLLLAKDMLGCTPVHLAAVQNQVSCICSRTSSQCSWPYTYRTWAECIS